LANSQVYFFAENVAKKIQMTTEHEQPGLKSSHGSPTMKTKVEKQLLKYKMTQIKKIKKKS